MINIIDHYLNYITIHSLATYTHNTCIQPHAQKYTQSHPKYIYKTPQQAQTFIYPKSYVGG